MLKLWLKRFNPLQVTHKYAINSRYLGDERVLAWSNLGYWDKACTDYVRACQNLADHLAKSVQLKASDRLLDLGCGHGASLQYWQQCYAIQDLTAVELQTQCVTRIQQVLHPAPTLYQASFLHLDQLNISAKFDVILCIDAAYHSELNHFLASVCAVLATTGRVAFHYLTLSEQFALLSSTQQQYYRYLLKAADINIDQFVTSSQLTQCLKDYGFKKVRVEDISRPVLNGFAQYIQQLKLSNGAKFNLDYLKINMTAKLCQQLYNSGLLHYVQVSAQL